MTKVTKWKTAPNVQSFDAKMAYAFYTKKFAMVWFTWNYLHLKN